VVDDRHGDAQALDRALLARGVGPGVRVPNAPPLRVVAALGRRAALLDVASIVRALMPGAATPAQAHEGGAARLEARTAQLH